jgi:hypothetical protein
MKTKEAFFTMVMLTILMMVGIGWGQLTPVFRYSFPESYNGSSNAIIDLSAAHNDGVMDS